MDNNLYTDIVQICRTCTKVITDASFFYLDFAPSANTQLTIRQTLYSCIPELDLSIVTNPVMCSKCVDILLSVFEFKKNCLKSEIQINKYIQQVQPTADLNLVDVLWFHQPDIKNLNIEVKIEDREITDGFKNEDLVGDTSAFNETSECAELFHQSDIKNHLAVDVKIKDFEITQNFKNEDLVCNTSAFNEAGECTESTEPKYLLELQKVETEDVLFNTLDDYNINYNLSAVEENSDAHNSGIVQDCLQGVMIEHQDHNYSKNVNKMNAYYQCYKCGYKAESELKLILHLKHHTRKNIYHEKIISRRLSRYHKNLIYFYRCSLCNYLTKYKILFDFHIRIHLIKNYYKYIFKLTNVHTKAFCTTIKVNKRNTNSNKRKHVKNCNNYHKYNFKNRDKFQQHLSPRNSLKPNKRSRIVEKLFKCSICEYYCNFKVSLNEHMQIHTDEKKQLLTQIGEKPFSCSICDYQFSCKGSLRNHIVIHTGEKPFSCSVCEYRCSRKYSLKRHLLIHTNEKPFSCSVCKFRCKNKGNLKQHMQTHTGEKPFSCSVCKHQCSRKGDLKKHMLIHSEEKPFSCSVCKYQSSQKGNLKKHMLIHTETIHVKIL